MDDTLWRELPDQLKFRKIMLIEEGLEYVLQNPSKYIYVAPKESSDAYIRIHFWDGKEENPFHFSPPVAGESPKLVSSYLPKGSSFSATFQKQSLVIEAFGLFRHKFMPEAVNVIGQNQ